MTDWREDGQAAHEMQLLQQQWLEDEAAQKEYQQHLDQLRHENESN